MTPSKLKLPKGGLSNSALWLAENNQAISCQSQRIFSASARYQLLKYHDRYMHASIFQIFYDALN